MALFAYLHLTMARRFWPSTTCSSGRAHMSRHAISFATGSASNSRVPAALSSQPERAAPAGCAPSLPAHGRSLSTSAVTWGLRQHWNSSLLAGRRIICGSACVNPLFPKPVRPSSSSDSSRPVNSWSSSLRCLKEELSSAMVLRTIFSVLMLAPLLPFISLNERHT